MQEYLPLLQSVKLFANIAKEDLVSLLSCIGAKVIRAQKGDIILLADDPVTYMGIVLAGTLHVSKEDIDGDRALLAALSPGELFAEVLGFAGVEKSPVTVTAKTNGAILQIDFHRILHNCSNTCQFHAQLIENMLGIVAHKNLLLQNRMEVIGKKTLRAKVLCYLNLFDAARSQIITIPLNREQLADYLCADRSALSHELSRMKEEGLIDYHKNSFRLL